MSSPAAENPAVYPTGTAESSAGELLALLALLVVGGVVMLLTISQAAVSAVLVFFLVCVAGLALCRLTERKLGDPALRVLEYFWLAKLAMTLLLLYLGWIPQLDEQTSPAWGYDPQRYFSEAKQLIDNEWSPDFLSLNYVGVLYYYGAIFSLLGYNPVVPAIVNAFVTLVAMLYLVRVGYSIKGRIEPGDWTLALVILLPESLWFDVMTSRETLVAALLIGATLPIGQYLTRRSKSPSLLGVLVVSFLAIVAVAAVRTPMVVAAIGSLLFMVLLLKPRQKLHFQRAMLIAAAALILTAGPGIATYLGGYEFDFADVLIGATSASQNIALTGDMDWSDNSIGVLLLPEGIGQAILFVVPRMILYLCAPLPSISVSFGDLAAGSWGAWQRLAVSWSAVINVLIIPLALASLVQSIRQRRADARPLVFSISYWITFAAIAGGNLIVQERYRVMAAPLLWGCAWLGARTCPRHLITRAYALWFGLLGFSVVFYLAYKGVV